MVPTARVQIGYRWRKKEKKMKTGRKWRGKERAGPGNIIVEYFALPAGKDFSLDKGCWAFRPVRAGNTDRNVTMKQPLAAADYFKERSGAGLVD